LVFELGGSVLKLRMLYWVIYLWLKTRALQVFDPGLLLDHHLEDISDQ
jgi:hypothetical protein